MESFILAAFIVPHPPIIVPAVGRGEEAKIAATTASYQAVAKRIAALRPETIIVFSPHAPAYADYIHISAGDGAEGDLAQFRARDAHADIRYDTELVKAVCEEADARRIRAGTLGERESKIDHGMMVPLTFILKEYSDCKFIRIGLSGLSAAEHYRFGMAIAAAAAKTKRRVVIVASGDMSHKLKDDGPYGFAKEGPVFDKYMTEAMDKGDFLKFLEVPPEVEDAAADCGWRSFLMMAGTLDGLAVKSRLLSYEGPFGVGYAVASFEPQGPDEKRRFAEIYEKEVLGGLSRAKESESEIVRLARASLESFVKNGSRIRRPSGISADLLSRKAGVFVSLKKEGRLRGCIGTIEPARGCVADEVIHNAVEAGTEDPRFPPVTEDELPYLVYSVDVLGKAEPIDSEKQLDPKKYGVIVTHGARRGLLLPNLEGVDTPKQQISISRQKAGIGGDEPVELERFEVVRYK